MITIESDFLKVRRCLLKVLLYGFDDKNEVCLLEILHSSNVESILAAEVYLNGLSGQELIVNYLLQLNSPLFEEDSSDDEL